MEREEILKQIIERKKTERYGRGQIMKDFGLTEGESKNLAKRADQYLVENKIINETPKIEMTVKGITIDQLRERYDNTYIVQKNAEQLKMDIFLTNAEFVQLCNFANNAGYRNAIEHPQFDKYHGKAGSVIYWSHPDSIKKLKDAAVLK